MQPYVIHGSFQDDIDYIRLIKGQAMQVESFNKVISAKNVYKSANKRVNKVQTKSLKLLRK